MSSTQAAKPYVVGLSGGIACGKSTVAEIFRELGATIIDTDVIARDIVAPNQPALAEIRSTFSDEIMGPDGRLDRKALRAIVFSDDEKRQQLESILHPRIRQEASRQVAAAVGPYQIVVVPLLVSSPMKSDIQRVVMVDCNEDVQVARLLERDTESDQQARRMIASQASRSERLAIADDVILNNDELQHTRQQVETLHRQYLARSNDRSD